MLSLTSYPGGELTDVLAQEDRLPRAKHLSQRVCVCVCVCVRAHISTPLRVLILAGMWAEKRIFLLLRDSAWHLYQVPILAGIRALRFLELLMLKRGEGIARLWHMLQPLLNWSTGLFWVPLLGEWWLQSFQSEDGGGSRTSSPLSPLRGIGQSLC